MNQWFRLYNTLVDDPKVQRLPAETFKGLINLWCLASMGGGILPELDDIAFRLRLTPQKATKLVADLQAADLIEQCETGLQPHNWSSRQHKSDVSNERVKRFRERQRNVTRAVSETGPDTETDTDTELEADASLSDGPGSSTERRPRSAIPRVTDDDFDRFWGIYPKRVDKAAARKAFDRVIRERRGTIDLLLAGAERYAAARTGEDPKYTKGPERWLNAGCWADEPAPAQRGPPRAGQQRPSTQSSAIAGILSGLDPDEI